MHFHWGVHVCTLNRFTVKKSEKGPHACCGYAAKRYTRRGAAHLAPCGPRRPPQHTPCPHTCRGPLCPLGRCASHSCRRRARATSRRNRALLRARLSAPYPSRSCLAAAPRRLERDRESFSLDFLVALVCFRAIFGDILEDEIASLPRRSVYRAWGSCSAATSAWQGGKARNAEPFARKTNYR